MSLVEAYRQGLDEHGQGLERTGHDEMLDDAGRLRAGWDGLRLTRFDASDLRGIRALAARLLENDGATYNPPPGTAAPGTSRATRWRVDPVPVLTDAETWGRLERGLVQRSELLEAVLEDLYGPRRLVAAGLVPAEILWRHGGYLRPVRGTPRTAPRLVIAATDLGRTAAGEWHVFGDRTQAPSGLGYAMENRRVVARVLQEAYRGAELQRLSSFFNQLRDTLVDVAPRAVEDPRVVVLTPGRHAETAFDHAFIAQLLGFPLVTGADLTMRDGRVWMRELDALRPVDVVIRRVDDTWCDPLELRPDSELGVPGLLEAVRRGTVVLANALGSGVVESPALHPLLPRLSEALLDESLRLPSAPSWWCGDPAGLSHVVARLDTMVIRPVSRTSGRGVYGPGLTTTQRDEWRARLEADPGAWVGQEVLELSTTPTVTATGLVPRPWTMRAFSVAREASYAVMPGALGMLASGAEEPRGRERVALSKDVWVLKGGEVPADRRTPAWPERVAARRAAVAMVPRALEDLFWFGRYAERAEDITRLLLVLRALADDFPHGGYGDGHTAVDLLARVLTHVTGTYPGLATTGRGDAVAVADELRDLLTDRSRTGSVAHALDQLAGSASSVRDQLSSDVFMILGSVERSRERLAETVGDPGPEVLDTGVHVLSGMLGLAGISGENMVRDVGWNLLDLGRALERALQIAVLLRWTFAAAQPATVEGHLVGAVLTATESAVTHRRRYAGVQRVETVLDLLLVDEANPRSVAFQVDRIRTALASIPGAAAHGRLSRLADELAGLLMRADVSRLAAATPDDGTAEVLFGRGRPELVALATELDVRLRALADAVAEEYFWHPVAPRPLGPSAPRVREGAR